MQQFHSFTKQVKIENKFVTVLIIFEYLAKFESGEYANLSLRVQALALNEKGSDFLGQVHVKSKTADQDLLEIADSHNMVSNAIDELLNNCKFKYLELKKIFE